MSHLRNPWNNPTKQVLIPPHPTGEAATAFLTQDRTSSVLRPLTCLQLLNKYALCRYQCKEKSNRRERGHGGGERQLEGKIQDSERPPCFVFVWSSWPLSQPCPNLQSLWFSKNICGTNANLLSPPHSDAQKAARPVPYPEAQVHSFEAVLAHLTQQGLCPAQSSLRKVTPSLRQGLKGQFQARLASEFAFPSRPNPALISSSVISPGTCSGLSPPMPHSTNLRPREPKGVTQGQSARATLAPHGKLGETRQAPPCCRPSSRSGLEEVREGAAF